MTTDDRFNEGVRLRASFLNAVAISAVVAGAFGALNSANWLAVMLFTVLGWGLHNVGLRTLDELRVSHAD